MRGVSLLFRLRQPAVLVVIGAFALAFAHASLWSAITPLWQTPDEAAHFEVATLTASLGRPVGPSDESPALQARMLRSMWENHYWEYLGLKRPERPPDHMVAGTWPGPGAEWPATWVIDDALIGYYSSLNNSGQPLYYLALAPVARLAASLPIDDQLRTLRFASRILFALAVAVIARAAWVLFDGSRALTIATIAFAGFQPMFAYIGAGLNNDNGVALAGAVVGLFVASGWRNGFTWKRLAVIALACAAAVLTKRTAIFVLVWVPLVLALRLLLQLSPVRRIRLLAIGGGAAAVILALAGWLYTLPGRLPAGWNAPPAAAAWTSQTAHSGSRAFSIGLAGAPALTATLPVRLDPRANGAVTWRAWARGGAGSLRLLGDTGRAADVIIESAPEWRPISITLPASGGYTRLVFVMSGSERQPLLIDDLRATLDDGSEFELPNASAEDIVPALGDVVIATARAVGVGGQAQLLVRDYRANLAALPPRIDAAARLMTATFWGRFGIFAVRDNPGVALATTEPFFAFAAYGLLSLVVQLFSRAEPPLPRGALLAWMAGVGLLIAQTVAPMLSFSVGGIWLPQGRYLFSGMMLLCPLTALALLGPLRERWRRPAVVIAIVVPLLLFTGWCAIQSLAYYSI